MIATGPGKRHSCRYRVMQATIATILGLGISVLAVSAAEFHVAIQGSDTNSGTQPSPFRSIQHAADRAQPGDVITVHQGVYRERINPPRGGTSDARRIVYRAAPGEQVEIKGSEIIKNWVKVQDDVWQVTLPNTFFGGFNPYQDLIRGDWFDPKGRQHHTGAVYLNGNWLLEAPGLDQVLRKAGGVQPPPAATSARRSGCGLWFGQVDQDHTTLWAQFGDANPNEQVVEINVRNTVFYPDQPGRNYITVRGFTLRQAATSWAPPTAEQRGLIGTHWSRGWIIESNVISHSKCSGVALGKYGDEWDNRAESAEGYVGTLTRALTNGWNKTTVGHHLVRNNDISYCEQAGIVGSLGCSFSTVTGNTIHDIHIDGLFGGAEMAGIKFHGAIDVEIKGNRIYRSCLGLWLDWMAQGARVTGNLFYDNSTDLFLEMQHGPLLVDNNLFLSKPRGIDLNSQGIAFVHNLFVGSFNNLRGDTRSTPYHPAHSTTVAGLYAAAKGDSGDDRFYNNLFVASSGLQAMDNSSLPCFAAGNVFTRGAMPSKFDTVPLLQPELDPAPNLVEQADGVYLEITYAQDRNADGRCEPVTTQRLGKAKVPDCAYENPDGSPLKIDSDYWGRPRSQTHPTPGPFEHPGTGPQRLKIW